MVHSMGNAIAWSYFSMFGEEKVIAYVSEDEAPCLICNSIWTDIERETYIGLFQRADIWALFGQLNESINLIINDEDLGGHNEFKRNYI